MPALRVAVLTALASLALSSARSQTTAVGDVDGVVRAEMERQHIPGVAVGVVRGGTVLTAKGYGLANVEHQSAVTPEAIFQSGSLGKMFTATAMMLLVEEG